MKVTFESQDRVRMAEKWLYKNVNNINNKNKLTKEKKKSEC